LFVRSWIHFVTARRRKSCLLACIVLFSASLRLSPVFPAFLGLMMKVFGDKSTGIYAIKLAAALILSLQLALYPVISRMLGMGEINGIIGASIWIVAKPHRWGRRKHQDCARGHHRKSER
jgi:hypothetical protein